MELVALYLLLSLSTRPILAHTYGCRYNVDLCSRLESCMEDNLFGTCQSQLTRAPVQSFHLSNGMKKVFIFALQGLLNRGYGWSDSYTQCIIGGLLDSYNLRLTPHVSYCDVMEQQRLRFPANNQRTHDLSSHDSDAKLLREYLLRWRHSVQDQTTSSAVEPKTDDGSRGSGEDDIQLLHLLTSGRLSVDQLSTSQIKRLRTYFQGLVLAAEPSRQPVEVASVADSKSGADGDGDKVIERVTDLFTRGGRGRLISSSEGSIGQQISDQLMEMEQRGVDSATNNSGDRRHQNSHELTEEDKVDSSQIDIIDTAYVWLKLDRGIDTATCHSLVRFIAQQLHVDMRKISDMRQDGEQLSFRVAGHYNTTELASAIEDNLSSRILSQFNITLQATGIGHAPAKLQIAPTPRVAIASDLTTVVIVSTVLVIILVAILILITWRCIYKNWSQSLYSYDKLSNHLRGESTQDSYEDLCRQRMQGAGEKQEDNVTPLPTKSDFATQPERLKSPRSSTSSWNEEPVSLTMDISTGHIVLAYMEDHLRNTERLEKEWLALSRYSAEDGRSEIGKLHMASNRYPDILPYDHNRVKLSDEGGGGYINASSIADSDPRSALYLATQGPMQHTVPQFWQMIWQQECTSIVLLTSLAEDNKTVCYQFWPSDGGITYGGFELRLVSEHIWCDAYLVRSLYLKNILLNQTRTITLFHFLSWPEQGVPQHCNDLLDFRRKVNKSYRGKSSPIVVCCSDGSGRSGAYILLDVVINRIHKGVKEVDIAATLEHLRDQRVGCVQTKEQFEFVLSAVAEEVQALLKALPQ